MACESFALHLVVRADVLAVLDGLSAVLGVLTIDGAADATASSQNLEDGASSFLALERPRMARATAYTSSQEMLPSWEMFFTFLRSLGGSFRAFITSAVAEGTTSH